MDNKSLSHTRWKCQYHIVFIPKYRKKVLYGRIRRDVREIIATLCKYKNVGNIVFRQKYIYGASFPAYDVWHISHSSEAF